ncbi:uncharacterized protein CcaverHIS019_0602350 [Cutaneotrichosporon cavernicola]|uniref:P-loop containing nucleoside triphosphate hydrolase protein n=1 Tax=Cutaneotrichosporon cavernicola TaxID=279322 RepID=A0AA48L8E3_9TREE|nr:uncharacterized protein CcaverHIS019_0602350 [Cutaneotrichosporon cavernicola]BEI93776.1 hypothetical protein CcaverHIS019_0602350 [Cutaneotrichosporon cavernicola]
MDAEHPAAGGSGSERPPTPSIAAIATPARDSGSSTRTSVNEKEDEIARTPHSQRASYSSNPPEPPEVSALLNLPPPLPFDLDVRGLTIGVPRQSRIVKLLQGDLTALKRKEGPRKTTILEDVSCACASGQVLAILGGSGSGKTTLLNAVAYRLNDLPIKVGGVAYVPSEGGMALGKHEAKRRIGFVRQQDFLVECLTVRETLTYAARLRLPTSLTRENIAIIVEQTLDELGLRDAADTVVGGPLRKGISGGERRRLSIGCVLVTLPSVLILDEPTSGLDAFTSYLLLQTLSALARRGRTVIISIHAPRSDAYPLFDRITLLSKGRVVYSGLRSQCLDWFSGLGHDVEPGINPLDFLIDVSSVDSRTPESEEASQARVQALTNAWAAHIATKPDTLAVRPLLRSSTSRHSAEGAELHRVVTQSEAKRPGFLLQTRVLTARAHRNVYRNLPILVGLLLQGTVLGVFMGVTYANIPDTPTGVQSLKNLSFQMIPGVFYLQQVFWVYKFCNDLIIFDREREDNLYDVVPYVLSDWVSFLLPAILSPAVYVIILWFIAGMRHDHVAQGLFTIIGSTLLVQCAIQGLALFVSSVTRSFAQASLIGNAINIFQLLSAGFVLVDPPDYAEWIRWLSPYFYSFRIVATVVFKDRVFDCPPISNANLAQCDGNNVLRGFNFDLGINIGVWFAGLAAFALFEYIVACLVLRYLPVGGVRHASEIDSHFRGKTADVGDSHMTRDRIDVGVHHMSLAWERRGRGVAKNAHRRILDDVSASFPAGEVSAILGPSGAGKSTLLQLIAGRHLGAGAMAGFTRTGDILFAGAPATAVAMSNVAFVEQEDDWHLPNLTVRETLRYAAILRLPNEMTRLKKIARAETVLRMLGLKDCADLPVGGPLIKGISGGEKRRLSLAVQMINDPAVLVVDEPTSGLDSSIALSVMQVLKDIAATGRTVIATIHQPRSDIWRLADNVMLLAKGGVVAYSGRRADAVRYFTGIGYPMPSEFFNPADHLLDLVSVDPRARTHLASAARVRSLTDAWRAISVQDPGEDTPHLKEKSWRRDHTVSEPEVGKLSSGSRTTSMRIALPVVLQRHWLNLWRQPEVFFNRWMQAPFVGALFILFFQRLTKGAQGAQDRIGLTLQSTSALAFVGLLNSMSIFPPERNLYLHEAASSARYSPATFVIMYTLVELAPEIFASLGYTAIMHVGVGMQTSASIFFQFFATIWVMQNLGESLCIIVGVWVRSEGLTVTILSTFLSLVAQTAGLVSLNVPRWLAAIAWGTPFKGAIKVQLINECVGLVFDCSAQQVSDGKCIAQTGEQIIALFGWRDLNVARFAGIMVATAVAWRILSWVSVAARVPAAMSQLTIWGRHNSNNVKKALWAAHELGLPFTSEIVGMQFGGTRTDSYLSMNPMAQIPTLQDGDLVVCESNAIVRYLFAEYGTAFPTQSSAKTRAIGDRWMDWTSTTLAPVMKGVFWPVVRQKEEERDWVAIRASMAEMERLLVVAEGWLEDHEWFSGDSFGAGDIPLGSFLFAWFEMPIERESRPRLEEWMAKLKERPAFQKAVVAPLT